jgi:hypothetical protein
MGLEGVVGERGLVVCAARQGHLAGLCEHGDELPSGFCKMPGIFDWL